MADTGTGLGRSSWRGPVGGRGGRRHRRPQRQRPQLRRHGLPHPQHRPHRKGGRAVCRLLRPAELTAGRASFILGQHPFRRASGRRTTEWRLQPGRCSRRPVARLGGRPLERLDELSAPCQPRDRRGATHDAIVGQVDQHYRKHEGPGRSLASGALPGCGGWIRRMLHGADGVLD
jgi:hypothetical protein